MSFLFIKQYKHPATPNNNHHDTPYTPSNGAQPLNPVSIWLYPRLSQGKPEKSEPEKSASQNQNAGESNQAVSDEQGSGVDKQLDRSAGTMDEQQQAMEQWLRQVPDNPGGLLRRKFAQQYFHREQQETPQTW